MEKLLRDLNIYAHIFMNCNLTFIHDGNRIRVQWDEIWPYVAESIILNKKFWFIKWLVENDKIDFSKFNFWNEIMYCVYEYTPEVSEEEELLMLLAIQEQPIRFLCEIIK